jgi:hypothetical protein
MTALRTAIKVLATTAAAVAVSLSGAATANAAPAAAAPAAAPNATPGVVAMTPASIPSFTMVAGQPQWEATNRNRLARSVFAVSADGRFAMVQPDGYPTLTGTISSDGTFRASASSSFGSGGNTNTEIQGQLIVGGDAVRLNLTYTAGSTTAAVVNGTPFGSSNTKAYRAMMTMRAA